MSCKLFTSVLNPGTLVSKIRSGYAPLKGSGSKEDMKRRREIFIYQRDNVMFDSALVAGLPIDFDYRSKAWAFETLIESVGPLFRWLY